MFIWEHVYLIVETTANLCVYLSEESLLFCVYVCDASKEHRWPVLGIVLGDEARVIQGGIMTLLEPYYFWQGVIGRG